MRRLHYFGWRQRKGIALLLVMFIAFASLVLLTTLFGSLAPRRVSVLGGQESDRALAIADGTIDRLLGLINNTGLTFSVASQSSVQDCTQALVTGLLLGINGGSAGDSYATVSANVRRYFYDITTDTYYVLKNDADPVATGTLTNLSTGVDVVGGFTGTGVLDPTYASDNRWFEMDTNAKYWYDPTELPDTWQIKVTAFNLSNPDIKRTIEAKANRGKITTTKVANGNWYVESIPLHTYFSDYSGLYHERANFGRFEVVSGYMRTDSDLWMGGWAQDKLFASGTVNDMAIDDGNAHDGNFGIDAADLAHTTQVPYPASGFVTNGVPPANWGDGLTALTTLLNKSKPAYFVDGSATLVFFVVGGAGKVSINGAPAVDLPPVSKDSDGNVVAGGAIYVNGDATVSGEVNGKVTIGANNNIFIGGNILYNDGSSPRTSPKTEKNDPVVPDNLQDKLGLIARNNIIIPVETYNANHTLEIDAAMLAVTGYFGVNPSLLNWNDPVAGMYDKHPIISDPPWVGIWDGSQSVWSGASAPAWSNGGAVIGYEEQHTNYDYNFANGARPPYFPVADDSTTVLPAEYPNYNTKPNIDILQALTESQLTPLTSGHAFDDGMRFSYSLDGKTYYCSNANSWNFGGKYNASANSLYRVSWKEEIAQPVVDTTP